MSGLQSVVISTKADGSWQAVHVPSGKVAHGLTKDEAEDGMREGQHDGRDHVDRA